MRPALSMSSHWNGPQALVGSAARTKLRATLISGSVPISW